MQLAHPSDAAPDMERPQFRLAEWVSSPHPELQRRINAVPACDLPSMRCAVVGPPQSGKTSLLFHQCYRLAAAGSEVVLLCRRAKLEAAPPLLPCGAHHCDPALQRIRIKYVERIQDVTRYAACLHLLPALPAAVAVDDLQGLLSSSGLQDRRARDAAGAKALALLADAADWAAHVRGAQLRLLASDTVQGEDAHTSYLLRRWMPLTLQLAGTPPGGLTLTLAAGEGVHLPPQLAQLRCSYSVTRTYISVDSVGV